MRHTEERVTTIAWNTSRSAWEVWKDGACVAHTRTLGVAMRKYPDAVVIDPNSYAGEDA